MSKSRQKLTAKERGDRCVQGTNDSSILSKCSTAAAGYFHDPYLRYFATKSSRRSPLIHRAYYVRAMAVQTCLDAFLAPETIDGLGPRGARQIVSLGAGFDSAFFRLRDSPLFRLDDVYVEIDFPALCRRKAALIRRSPILREKLGLGEDEDADKKSTSHSVVIDATNYKLIGVDLSKIPELAASLESIGVSFTSETFFLSEVVLPYMSQKNSDCLLDWCSHVFPNCVFVSYEQTNPRDAFGRIMIRHFESLGSPLKYIQHYPSVALIHNRYSADRFSDVRILDMNRFYSSVISEDERRRVSRLECFDEEEEWAQKCAHYVVVIAASGTLRSIPGRIAGDEAPWDGQSPATIAESLSPSWSRLRSPSPRFLRFGHSLTRLDFQDSTFAVIVGGFGAFEGGHRREAAVDVLRFDDLSVATTRLDGVDVLGARLFHSVTDIGGGRILVFGGRSSPAKPLSDPVSLEIKRESSPESEGFLVKATPFGSSNAPSPRWRHSATLLAPSAAASRQTLGTQLLIFGGKLTYDAVTNEAFLLDCDDACWTRTDLVDARDGETPLPALCSHTADLRGDRVVVFGGLGDDFRPRNSILELDVDSRTFVYVSPKVGALTPRFGHSAHVHDGVLIAIGGVTDSGINPGVGVFDFETGVATEYVVPPVVDGDVLMLRNHRSFLRRRRRGEDKEEESEVVVIGGGGNCFSFGSHYNEDFFVVSLPVADRKP